MDSYVNKKIKNPGWNWYRYSPVQELHNFEVVLSCEIMQNLFSSLKGSTMVALLTEHSCLVSVFKSVTFESQHWGLAAWLKL